VTDAWADSSALSDKQRAALAFTDDVLSNTAGAQRWLSSELGFDDQAREELIVGLGLFHGFSKALIALGCEPAPGAMDVTELPTPNANVPWGSLRDGMVSLHDAVNQEVDVALMEVGRSHLRTSLGLAARPSAAHANEMASAVVGAQPAIEIADLFVIDIHSVTDEQVAALVADVGEAGAVAYFVGLAAADAQARMERSAL
jgi:hypothetical protein